MELTATNITLIGALHQARGLPCEDASGVLVLRGAMGVVGCVADGHGDAIYVRSDRGARFAVEAAMQVLERFALSGERPQNDSMMARLKQELVSIWASACGRDLAAHPLDENELAALPAGWGERDCVRLYGTTLVAALCTREYVLLLQQGDGCAALLYGTGEWTAPVPPDPYCVGHVTTSLADDDAAQRMRHAIVPVAGDSSPLACMVMTDGIEKAAVAYEGFNDVLDMLALARDEEARGGVAQLGKTVRRLSMGTGDDSSVACIGSSLLPDAVSAALRARHESFSSQTQQSEVRAKLVSMSRKHDHLEQLWNAGKRDEARDYPAVHATYEALKEQLRMLTGDEFDARGSVSDESSAGASEAWATPEESRLFETAMTVQMRDQGSTDVASSPLRTTSIPQISSDALSGGVSSAGGGGVAIPNEDAAYAEAVSDASSFGRAGVAGASGEVSSPSRDAGLFRDTRMLFLLVGVVFAVALSVVLFLMAVFLGDKQAEEEVNSVPNSDRVAAAPDREGAEKIDDRYAAPGDAANQKPGDVPGNNADAPAGDAGKPNGKEREENAQGSDASDQDANDAGNSSVDPDVMPSGKGDTSGGSDKGQEESRGGVDELPLGIEAPSQGPA